MSSHLQQSLGFPRSRRHRFGIELLESRHMLSGTPTMLQDIGQRGLASIGGSFNNAPVPHFASFDGMVFFSADNGVDGPELWKTDGTESGTVMVKDIVPGAIGASPGDLAVVGDALFFMAGDGTTGRELWKTDGTDLGTVLVKDMPPSFFSTNLVAVSDQLFFVEARGKLWKSDGTEAGTLQVSNLPLDNWSGFTPYENDLYFQSSGQLWKTDGSEAGTMSVSDRVSSGPVEFGGELFFIANDQLRKTNGTVEGTTVVADIPSRQFFNLSVAGEQLFFTADNTSNRILELWKTDGSNVEMVPLQDLLPSNMTFETILAAVSGTLFFAANDADADHGHGRIWTTDGTADGTHPVGDLQPTDVCDCGYGHAAVGEFDGQLVLAASRDDDRGVELWRTDGTEQGTVLVKDIHPGFGDSSTPKYFYEANGELYFAADDGKHGHELWKSDGTSVGTQLVKDINPFVDPAGYSSPREFVELDRDTLFLADGGLYKTDGSSEGTKRVRSDLIVNSPLVQHDGKLFFSARGAEGFEIWKSDGTDNGTVLVSDIRLGEEGSYPSDIVSFADQLYFSAADAMHGRELWKTDGTEHGTALVEDLHLGTEGSSPHSLATFGGELFFSADGKLWKTDDTEDGIIFVEDVTPGSYVEFGGELYFSGADGQNGPELWKTDGTTAGTVHVKDLVPGAVGSYPQGFTEFNGRFFFSAAENDSNKFQDRELWVSDGTELGTTLLKDINPNVASSHPRDFVVVADALYFLANGGPAGNGLWKSDGTSEGTQLFRSGVDAFAVRDEQIYYLSALRKLWKTDGTTEGTVVVADAFPAMIGGPTTFQFVNGLLFFAANDGIHGFEPWIWRPEPIPGDANSDEEVDFADFLILAENFGREDEVLFGDGDFDEDGVIDFADFLLLSANFGRKETVDDVSASANVLPVLAGLAIPRSQAAEESGDAKTQ